MKRKLGRLEGEAAGTSWRAWTRLTAEPATKDFMNARRFTFCSESCFSLASCKASIHVTRLKYYLRRKLNQSGVGGGRHFAEISARPAVGIGQPKLRVIEGVKE